MNELDPKNLKKSIQYQRESTRCLDAFIAQLSGTETPEKESPNGER